MANKGIWLTPAEIAALPSSGTAFNSCKSAADGSIAPITSIRGNNYDGDVQVLACAIMAAKLGGSYIAKAGNLLYGAATSAPEDSGGDQDGGLGVIRNTNCIVLAADIMDMQAWDAAKETTFKNWITTLRNKQITGNHSGSIVEFSEKRPNNFFGMAMSSRVAISRYINDTTDVNRCAQVMQGWLGDRSQYASFDYGTLGWQCNPSLPVGINPSPCVKTANSQTFDIGGALPDDMRRGSANLTFPAAYDAHIWGCMTNFLPALIMLKRAGFPSYTWSNSAVDRAADCLWRMSHAGWSGWPSWATGDDETSPWLINYILGSGGGLHGSPYPASSPTSIGKNMGWTDYTHATAAPPGGPTNKFASDSAVLANPSPNIVVTGPTQKVASDSATLSEGGNNLAKAVKDQSLPFADSSSLTISTVPTTRDFRVRGQNSLAQAIFFNIRGFLTSNTSRDFRITGDTDHFDFRDFRISGTDDALTTREFYVSGEDLNSRLQDFKITGFLTSSSPNDFRVSGTGITSNDFDLVIIGREDTDVDREFYITGLGGDVEEERDLAIFGDLQTENTTDLRIFGFGGAAIVTVFYLEIPSPALLQEFSVTDTFVESDMITSDAAAIPVTESIAFTDNAIFTVEHVQDLRITGQLFTFTETELKMFGTTFITISETRDLRITGQLTSSIAPDARVFAQARQDFEGGVVDDPITPANTGGEPNAAFDSVVGANVTFDDTEAGGGTLSAEIFTRSTADMGYLEWDATWGDNANVQYGRLYYRLSDLPTAANRFVRVMSAGGVTLAAIRTRTDGRIELLDSADNVRATSATALDVDKWYRIEWYITHSVSNGQIICRIYEPADGASITEEFSTPTNLHTGVDATKIRFGLTSTVSNWPTATGSFWIDEIVAGGNVWVGSAVAGTEALQVVDLKLFAVAELPRLVDLRITGTLTDSKAQDFRISGEGDTDTAPVDVRITGTLDDSQTRDFRIGGKDTSNAARDLRISGTAITNRDVDLRLRGTLNSNVARDLRITGIPSPFVDTSRDLRIEGAAPPIVSEARDLRIVGKAPTNTTRTLMIRGVGTNKGWPYRPWHRALSGLRDGFIER